MSERMPGQPPAPSASERVEVPAERLERARAICSYVDIAIAAVGGDEDAKNRLEKLKQAIMHQATDGKRLAPSILTPEDDGAAIAESSGEHSLMAQWQLGPDRDLASIVGQWNYNNRLRSARKALEKAMGIKET